MSWQREPDKFDRLPRTRPAATSATALYANNNRGAAYVFVRSGTGWPSAVYGGVSL